MKKLFVLAISLTVALMLTACTKPTDIVFGPEPVKQMAEQGDQFRRLSEEDRMLLVGYIGLNTMAQNFGAKDVKPIPGRTVGEVLVDARAWKAKLLEQEAIQKKMDVEAEALRNKILAERKAISDKLGEAVTVAVTGKKVHKQDYSASRLYDELELNYAVENKTDKPIRQLKGLLHVSDATGELLGTLPIDFNQPIGAKSIIKTNTGSVWLVKRFNRGTIEKVADAQFEGMKARFEVEVIAYTDGEVVKAPELPESK